MCTAAKVPVTTRILSLAESCPETVVFCEADFGGGMSGSGAPLALGVRTMADVAWGIRGIAAGLVEKGIAPPVSEWGSIRATESVRSKRAGMTRAVHACAVHSCRVSSLLVHSCSSSSSSSM